MPQPTSERANVAGITLQSYRTFQLFAELEGTSYTHNGGG